MLKTIWPFFLTLLFVFSFQRDAHSQDLVQPAQVVELAYKHITRVEPHLRPYIRYLDAFSFPPDERENAFLVGSGHIQHLSRSLSKLRLNAVPGTAGGLYFINLTDYKIGTDIWEQLANQEPYYHSNEVINEPIVEKVYLQKIYWASDGKRYGYSAVDGRWYAATNDYYTIVKDNFVKKFALAPWLIRNEYDKQRLSILINETKSIVPIVRLDWFFNQTAAAQDRKPNYYDFLGIKDKKSFERIVGFDDKLFKDFTYNTAVRASVGKSGVARHSRALARKNAIGISYWLSFDFILLKNNNNPIEILGEDIESKADAMEVYGGLPNGFWATAAFNNKGEIQDVVPNSIATDKRSKSNDNQIHPNVSCVRCHYEGGLKPIKDWQRSLTQPPLKLNIWNFDPVSKKYLHYEDIVRIREEYSLSLEVALKKDRNAYEESVKEVTGWTSKEYSDKYSAFWERYEDADVDLKFAARDLGVTEKHLKDAIVSSIKANLGDHTISILVQDGQLNSIPIKNWILKVPTAYRILASYSVK